MHSARFEHNNYRKHDSEERRSCDVIQKSGGTTIAKKKTTARMTARSNYMLIDFRSLTPEARVASCQSGLRLREADCKVFIRYKWVAISEFHDFCEVFTIANKITLLCDIELREELVATCNLCLRQLCYLCLHHRHRIYPSIIKLASCPSHGCEAGKA
jgi:hypothetical protein